MKHYLPPLPDELPDLPIDCDEIQATTKPDHDKTLEKHIDQLPGLDRERFNRLSNVADFAEYGGVGNIGPGATVLGLNDLLRQHGDGTIGLHPRVTHVVPIGTLDPLLETVCELMDGDSSMNAYQYPAHLLECRGGSCNMNALYPPEYHIKVADIARSLRANHILTSVRGPGQPFPESDELRATVEAMNKSGEQVEETISVFQPEGEFEPSLYIGGGSNKDNSPSRDQISDHCGYLFHRHGMLLDIRDFEDRD
ncbi:hypothetical protein [Halobacteriaceae bacterium SHR40]|uniref:hypothetical protein n=1 Tax=Halovenus amylolytica TaxID=2500550 RepID=UPI000FE43462